MGRGGVTGPHPTRSTSGGVRVVRGGVWEQACSEGALLRRIFAPSEPNWETGDDRAKLEGSQGCSNLVPT